MFIPYQSILIPLIQFLQGIKVYGTYSGLILVHVVYGYGYYKPNLPKLFRRHSRRGGGVCAH